MQSMFASPQFADREPCQEQQASNMIPLSQVRLPEQYALLMNMFNAFRSNQICNSYQT